MPHAVKESVSGQDESHTVWICFYTAITCYNTVLSFFRVLSLKLISVLTLVPPILQLMIQKQQNCLRDTQTINTGYISII